MDKKRVLGQFFTKDRLWLKPQILAFIQDSGCSIAYDPFAGAGDLLNVVKENCGLTKTIGLDIDSNLNWQTNDSLLNIPHLDNALIITNPPYITKYSASRKGLGKQLEKYFENSIYTDVYLIALDKMLAAQDYVVAIIPETFINSAYRQKNLLYSITVLEENPFEDTENPVIVACFDSKNKSLDKVKIYKNDQYISSLGDLEKKRLAPTGSLEMSFNNSAGWLAVRCVDTTNPNETIKFDFKNNIDYDWNTRIKVSSRLLTLVQIDIPNPYRQTFINECNRILSKIREETNDIILSPFKGNMKNGRRRRRLDYSTCRAIIETAYQNLYGHPKTLTNLLPTENINSHERKFYANQQALF